MIISRLDTDFIVLLKAQLALQHQTKLEGKIVFSIPLEYIEPRRLGQELKELPGIESNAAEADFLRFTKRFSDDFIEWYQNVELPSTKVTINDNKVLISATGSIPLLTLSEQYISSIIAEHHFAVYLAKTNSTEDLYIVEGVRRFQTKADLLRDFPNCQLILGGTANRVNFDWQNVIATLALGEFSEKITGVTNALVSLAYGIPVVGYQYNDVWLEQWDVKDIYPDGYDVDWMGGRFTNNTIDDVPLDYTIIFKDMGIFEMAHTLSHHPDHSIIFELDESLNADVGAIRPNIQISRKIFKPK